MGITITEAIGRRLIVIWSCRALLAFPLFLVVVRYKDVEGSLPSACRFLKDWLKGFWSNHRGSITPRSEASSETG